MNLTLEIIKSYGFEEMTYKPDWDDVSVDFTLPNGLVLTTSTVCCNQPTESDTLEGLDGFIHITTKEELDELVKLDYNGVSKLLKQISEDDEDFKPDEW
jgi:hypothetical protein